MIRRFSSREEITLVINEALCHLGSIIKWVSDNPENDFSV
jgi:hypothetical protein